MTPPGGKQKPPAVGVVGLGVMGGGLARNLARNGFPVAAYTRTRSSTEAFAAEHASGGSVAAGSPAELAAALSRPRRVLLMVPAGEAVDKALGALLPHLGAGDVVMDGGNSHFRDTARRQKELAARGVQLLGVGVSGGAKGALEGPSIMPGGPREAYEAVRPMLEAIAAKTEDGPCVTWVGSGGAGHFVKMVHNGIEYGDMQLLAEAYDLLRKGLGMEAGALAATFASWNEGWLRSYLMEITVTIFRVRDPATGAALVDAVLDRAAQKGTGRWTVEAAFELGVSAPAILAAVDARVVSSAAELRAALAAQGAAAEAPEGDLERERFQQAVHDGLLASRVCCLAQGMSLIRAASEHFGWGIDRAEVARIWQGGCIIRSALLGPAREALRREGGLADLLLEETLSGLVARSAEGWRRAVAEAARRAVPVPATAASLAWHDALRAGRLPQNLVQAQRDYFGAHGYRRADRPEDGPFHTDWEEEAAKG